MLFAIKDLSARSLCLQFGQRRVPKSPTESNKCPYLDRNLISDAVGMLFLQARPESLVPSCLGTG